MGGPRVISQEAFDAVVRENMEELGMDADDALADAVDALTLQGVDLHGIVKRVPGTASSADTPVIRAVDGLKAVVASLASSRSDGALDGEKVRSAVELLDELHELCCAQGSDDASIAARNGVIEALLSLCSSLNSAKLANPLASSLKTLSAVIRDIQSSEMFRQNDGPRLILDLISEHHESSLVLDRAFSVVAAASAGNEVVKEAFVDLDIVSVIVVVLREQSKSDLQGLYDAIRILLTPDDNRVVASQVYGYARRFAEKGIAELTVNALSKQASSSCLPTACAALKAIAVNDEICQCISESGGISIILKCIDESGEHKDKLIFRSCCSLLSKLAGSDANKTAIVQQDGLGRLMQLCSCFSDEPSAIQEVMSIVTVLTLRSPDNASRAMEAGYGDMAIEAMEKFPASPLLQRQACLMIRNLVVRNPENRAILLNNGIEKLIRKAKAIHVGCKDAASAALRDLGLDNYNT